MKKSLQRYLRSLPLRTVLIVPFVLQVVGTVGLVGFLSFRAGQKSVATLTTRLKTEITFRIQERLTSYLSLPHQINRLNFDAVQLGNLDPENVPQLEKQFWRQMQQFDQATYIYFGSPDSIFVGAGVEDGKITIGASQSAPPDKFFNTYATDVVRNRGQLLSAVPGYEMLGRPWYRTAIAHTEPVWGKPYIWAAPYPNLALPAVMAIYTPEFQGVFAVDFSLADISAFLAEIEAGETGKTFILERDGNLIANSGDALAFKSIPNAGIERLLGVQSTDPLIQATSQYLNSEHPDLRNVTESLTLKFRHEGRLQLVQVTPFKDEYGLDWLIVVVIPEADFMAQIYKNARRTILLCALAFGISITFGIVMSRWILQPIWQLNSITQKLAQGEWQQDIKSDRRDELGDLTRAVATMASQLENSFNTLEERVAQRTEELAQSNEELVVAKEKAEIAAVSKSRFLAQMSHELRTPLNAILGFAQLLQRSPNFDANERENLEIMQRSGEHLLGLINNVLDFSKIEAGHMELQIQPANLAQICHDVGGLFREQAQQKQLTLEVNYPQDVLPNVLVDAQKLRQVLINLLGNALKFTTVGSVSLSLIFVSEDSENIQVQWAIADTGEGIDEAEQKQLFQAFQQTESGIATTSGTGLGLVISQQFIQLMGSKINIESQRNQGSTFSFLLDVPIYQASLDSPEIEVVLPRTTQSPEKKKILIVDDSSINRLLFRKLFRSTNLEIQEACNGEEAIAQWQSWQPDLIFMDLLMPVMDLLMPAMDGHEATQTIRSLEADQSVVIIGCTASLSVDEKDAMITSGCDDFLGKPFRAGDVFRLIDQYLHIPVATDNSDSDAGTSIENH